MQSLYQRALGYQHKAVKIFLHEGKSITVEYIERYPPDTTACIFWLKNRSPADWRDRPRDDEEGDPAALVILARLQAGRQRVAEVTKREEEPPDGSLGM